MCKDVAEKRVPTHLGEMLLKEFLEMLAAS